MISEINYGEFLLVDKCDMMKNNQRERGTKRKRYFGHENEVREIHCEIMSCLVIDVSHVLGVTRFSWLLGTCT